MARREGFIRRQFRKVIEWEEEYKTGSNATLVYKYPLATRSEIMKRSTLVVREGQQAILVNEGKLADVFSPGTYELSDLKNIPILTELYNWKTAWVIPTKVDVYYINTRHFLDLKWGTSNPIMLRDKEFGVVRLRGYGTFSISSGDPERMIKNLFGSLSLFRVADVEQYFKKIVVSRITDVIAEAKIAAIDLAMQYDELGEKTHQIVQGDFDKLGLVMESFFIENLSLPREVEEMLDKRSGVGVMDGAIGAYTQLQAAEALRDAAQNESGGLAGAGVGLGAGLGIGKVFSENLSTDSNARIEKKKICKKCSASISEEAKFCPRCGNDTSEGVECSKCHVKQDANAKFCANCGNKMGDKNTCSKCQSPLKESDKFCGKCGTPK